MLFGLEDSIGLAQYRHTLFIFSLLKGRDCRNQKVAARKSQSDGSFSSRLLEGSPGGVSGVVGRGEGGGGSRKKKV